MARVLRAPFDARTWRETFHLLLNLPVGIATFSIVVTGFAMGLGMLITLLGRPSRITASTGRSLARGAFRPRTRPSEDRRWDELPDPEGAGGDGRPV